MMQHIKRPFKMGRVLITRDANDRLNGEDIITALRRHAASDWGELCDGDWMLNDRAVRDNDGRILSIYRDGNNTEFWIITESDRRYTTVLLPSDY